MKFLVNVTIRILYRRSGYYDRCLFIQHGVSLLEDLVITLADGIASMYLELISVDSSTSSSEMNSLDLSLCSLSTRALQRLRNEVPVPILFAIIILLLVALPLSSHTGASMVDDYG